MTNTGGPITYQGTKVEIKPEESILNALLRNGYKIPFGCQAGACHSCIMQADKASRASITAASQHALTPAQRRQGLFLACCAYPKSAITASLPETTLNPSIVGTVISVTPLGSDVLQLLVNAEFNYEPGQYANLIVTSNNHGELQRCYSMATAPKKDHVLEYHIKQLIDGKFSDWLLNEAKTGDEIKIAGPHGLCQVNFDDLNSKNIVLAGASTGLAPLLSILEELNKHQYTGEVNLLFTNRTVENFYHVETLKTLVQRNENLTVHLLAQEQPASAPFLCEDIDQYIKKLPVDLSLSSIFLCGAESFVEKMRKACFLRGAAMKKIKSDVFTAS